MIPRCNLQYNVESRNLSLDIFDISSVQLRKVFINPPPSSYLFFLDKAFYDLILFIEDKTELRVRCEMPSP